MICKKKVKNDLYFFYFTNTSLNCLATLTNVVHLESCFKDGAPTDVQVDRIPPKMSYTVLSTFPLYGTLTVRPSEDR